MAECASQPDRASPQRKAALEPSVTVTGAWALGRDISMMSTEVALHPIRGIPGRLRAATSGSAGFGPRAPAQAEGLILALAWAAAAPDAVPRRNQERARAWTGQVLLYLLVVVAIAVVGGPIVAAASAIRPRCSSTSSSWTRSTRSRRRSRSSCRARRQVFRHRGRLGQRRDRVRGQARPRC